MNPLIAVVITGVAMFAAHILVILLFREKAAKVGKPRAAEAPAADAGAPVAAPEPAAPAARRAVKALDAEALAGRTTSAAARLADRVVPRTADDTSPLMGRRGWMGLAWGAFTASTAGCLAATGRFMFPNVLNEPPQQFTIGFPEEYGEGVDERWKDRFGVWVVRTPFDEYHESAGFYALLVTCTHLGCTPNWLSAESKFKCPCHGSGFRPDGHQLRGTGAAPARARPDCACRGRTDPDRQGPQVPGGAGAVDRPRSVPRGVARCRVRRSD